jgi:hypothetical protein
MRNTRSKCGVLIFLHNPIAPQLVYAAAITAIRQTHKQTQHQDYVTYALPSPYWLYFFQSDSRVFFGARIVIIISTRPSHAATAAPTYLGTDSVSRSHTPPPHG